MMRASLKHNRHTVLIVDDDAEVRATLEDLMEEDNHEVYSAENGQEALDIVKVIRPCIILTDMRMPVMNGFQFCRKLKEDPSTASIPIVLVTAMIRDEDVKMGIEYGATDYIKKPFDRYETRMRVLSQIRLHETLRQKEELEKELGFVSRAAKDGIIVIDAACTIIHWNEASTWIFGYTSREAVGRELQNLITKKPLSERQQNLLSRFLDTNQDNDIKETLEMSAVKKDGEEIAIELSVASSEIDGVRHAVCIVRDISERKRLENQLLQTQKLESIGQLSSGIAHEINTPTQYVGDNIVFCRNAFRDLLNLFDTYERLIGSLRDDPKKRRLLQELEKAKDEADIEFLETEIPNAIGNAQEGIARITKIVRAMKEYAHPGTGTRSLADINHLLETTLTVCRNELKYVAELAMDLDPALPQVICCPDELNQVFLNLLVNAAHAIAEIVGDMGDKGTITVRTKKEKSNILIEISDTGCGIPPQIEGRVFDPFFTTKPVGKGTGQGLAIARSIVVDKHGGSLTFDTGENRGTTFYIRLPVR
jgi:two-component system, NtrC family, sensor kinase